MIRYAAIPNDFTQRLNAQFFQMFASHTRAMGRFVDVVRGFFSVSQSIGYVSYLSY